MNEARRRYVNLRSIGMSVFNKKEDADQEPVGKKAAEPTAGKGRPTPKRKDAQAQNLLFHTNPFNRPKLNHPMANISWRFLCSFVS